MKYVQSKIINIKTYIAMSRCNVEASDKQAELIVYGRISIAISALSYKRSVKNFMIFIFLIYLRKQKHFFECFEDPLYFLTTLEK